MGFQISSFFSCLILYLLELSHNTPTSPPPPHPHHAVHTKRTFPESALQTPPPENSTPQQSEAYTKLAVGVAVGLGLPVFAALWALAFVLWGRSKRQPPGRGERDFVSVSGVEVENEGEGYGDAPRVPEKDGEWMVVRPLRCWERDGRGRWEYLRGREEGV